MTTLRAIPHPDYGKLIGKECIIKYGKHELQRTIHFVGRNAMGQGVVSWESEIPEGKGGMIWIKDWNRLHITEIKH